ncbi:MAG: nucleotidyltransferase domain-containing protein [Candidatus Thiodiazotropha taylori]|nr:nucleotidyltransferase domain-containing protein [Candidatus Thiodiazotropha taylori]
MTVNSYLTNLANTAIIRDQEQESIRRSISALQNNLNRHFGTDITQQLIFGSYSRGTILPRSMDEKSDVDYMVVFADSSSRPQTYLNRLRRFVEQYYSRSEISQSNPTIVLSLNHIRFELVPAVNGWLSGLQIPAKASDYEDWISTDPTGFNQELVNANQSYGNQIKPLVRVVKYWNARNGYPFESYSLEQNIVQHGFGFLGLLGGRQLKDYFYDYIEGMDAGLFAPKWKQEAVSRAHQLAEEAKSQERQGYTASAEATIKKLLPPLGLLA